MFTVLPIVAQHIHRALVAEIGSLEQISTEVGDNWPPGFDVNDIGVLACIAPDFEAAAAANAETSFSRSKPLQFAIRLLPAYLAANRAALSSDEAAAIEATIVQYGAFDHYYEI
jgi:hypothetical protein